jgi:large subunit ribosomal protein L7/L12
VSFDQAKKIALIKEVRTYLNLGLKEAKDLVEKVPGLIKGNVNRAEAEEIAKKFEENGAKIELV